MVTIVSAGYVQYFCSRSHAPHGNAFWMRRIQLESFMFNVCNGLQRRPGWVPMQRMGTRQLYPVSSIICGTWTVTSREGRPKLDKLPLVQGFNSFSGTLQRPGQLKNNYYSTK